MKKLRSLFKLFLLLACFLNSYSAIADNLYSGNIPATTSYTVCFTPGGQCTDLIVDNINKAKKTILVQAYSFTSAPIAKALANAKTRGVDVRVILDKSDFSKRYTISTYLLNNNISVWKDYSVSIAHNKVIIIDSEILVTGSFNYTKAAQNKNAENLLVINSPQLTKIYTNNWYKRLAVSRAMYEY